MNPYTTEYNADPQRNSQNLVAQSNFYTPPTQPDNNSVVTQPVSQPAVLQPEYPNFNLQPNNYGSAYQPEYRPNVPQFNYQSPIPQPDYHNTVPQANYFYVNNYVNSTNIEAQGRPPHGNIPRADAANKDENDEVGTTQYLPLSRPQPFLSVEEFEDSGEEVYTEFQIGVNVNPQISQQPKCGKCDSRRTNGHQPIIYVCTYCVKGSGRALCKRCAQKELTDNSSSHKPSHTVRKWQPTWRFNFKGGLDTPMLHPEMEELAQELSDDVRALIFESCVDFDEKAIRLFLPSPGGACRIEAQVQVKSVTNERIHKSIMDTIKLSSSEVAGSVRLSAYPCALSPPPIAPREALPEHKEPHSFASIDITRDADLSELQSLVVFINTSLAPNRGIELIFQDEDRKSKKFVDEPFEWALKTVSITHIPKLENFATEAQKRQYKVELDEEKKRQEKRVQDDKARQERIDKTKERISDYNDWKEWKEQQERKKMDEYYDWLARTHGAGVPQELERGRPIQAQDLLLVVPNMHLRSSSAPSNPSVVSKTSGSSSNRAASRSPARRPGHYEHSQPNITSRLDEMHLHPNQTQSSTRRKKRPQTARPNAVPHPTMPGLSAPNTAGRKPGPSYHGPGVPVGAPRFRRRR